MTALRAGALALAILAGAAAPALADGGPLRVCLDEGIPPLSSNRRGEARGFDLAVAQAVAARLGRDAAVQWFESELDDDGDPAEQANALLSDGRCRLVGGYPLFADALGRPESARSRLPEYEGAEAGDRRRWVPLNELAASRAYRFVPLAVVLGPGMAGRAIDSLGDLKGVRLGVEEGTLADAILMTYGGRVLIPQITHVAPEEGLLERLERGDFDATLVELHRFDAWRARHPETGLSSSGHYHSVGFNAGFVGLASDAGLIAEVNAAIGGMLAGGELPALAAAAGLTFVPPRPPDIVVTIPAAALRGD